MDGRIAVQGLFVPGITALASAQPAAQSAASPPAQEQPAGQTASQGSANPFEHVQFGVALEGYYQYNWNRPLDRVNLLRAYDTRANVFSLQQAAVVVESVPAVDAGRRFGARIDLQFGQATATVQAARPTSRGPMRIGTSGKPTGRMSSR